MRNASNWNAAPAALPNPSSNSAASFPTRNPPLQIVFMPFDGSEIVAYRPFPILRTEAKPLSTRGVCATRESLAVSAASAGSGISLAAAKNAPKQDVLAINLRRENPFDNRTFFPQVRDTPDCKTAFGEELF